MSYELIFVIILILLIIVTAILYAFLAQQNKIQISNDTTLIPYRRIWVENFTDEIDERPNYSIWTALDQGGNRLGLVTGNPNQFGYYTSLLENLRIVEVRNTDLLTDFFIDRNIISRNRQLKIESVNSPRTIITPGREINYEYSSGIITTNGKFLNGFFTVEFTLDNNLTNGFYPFFRLLPFINPCGYNVGSIYGQWPNCGEIDLLEPIEYIIYKNRRALRWTGGIWFGEKTNPVFRKIIEPKPLYLGRTYRIGCLWESNKISWYLDPQLDANNEPSGILLGEIYSDSWYSITDGKQNLPPAPFNSLFNFTMGLLTGGDRYPPPSPNLPEKTGLLVNSLIIYQKRGFREIEE